MKEFFFLFVSAFVGSYSAYLFTSRAKRDESILRFKEEKYARLLVKLQGFVGITTNAQLKREFFEEQYQSWLYASDDVVRAINAMVQHVKAGGGKSPDPEAGEKAVGEIALAMRRDLLRHTTLDYKMFQYTDVIDNEDRSCATSKPA